VDRFETEGGEPIDVGLLAQRLYDLKIHGWLPERGSMQRTRGLSQQEGDLMDLRWACESLCHEWANLLLGNSFGTGNYSMYGAFKVDLQKCTITDDPDAEPIVENIQIAE